MNERQAQELAILRTRYPRLQVIEDGLWVRIPSYAVPGDSWTMRKAQVAFQIPADSSQEPYGFYAPKELALKSGATIQSYGDAATPFGGAWGKFSWSITWQPAAEIAAGTKMLDFVTSFAGRFLEGT